MERLGIDLETITLSSGSHETRDDGMCAMEAAAWLAGEPHTAAPQCTCPVITRMMIRMSDHASDERRQELKPLLPLVIGTRGSEQLERRRAWMCADWALRWALPIALRAAKLEDDAKALEAMPEFASRESWLSRRKEVLAIRKNAYDAAAAYDSAAYATTAAAYATYAAAAYAYVDSAYAAAAYAAAYAASYAAYAYAAYAAEIWRGQIDLVRRLCAV